MEAEDSMDLGGEYHSQNTKRFVPKNCIQASLSDDYVFQIVPKDDWTSMAVSLSTHTVKLYCPLEGQYLGECQGHTGTINQIAFFDHNVLCSCSSDGTIRAWDTRNYDQVACIRAGCSQEIFSFSFGGSAHNLLAAGSKSQIFFWDWRNKMQVACLEDCHIDDVTQVHFFPDNRSKLLSASADGLICVFNTDKNISDEEDLESVLNVGTSISKVGFFGEMNQKLWCLTHIESLSIWDLKDARKDADFQEARLLASRNPIFTHVDYLVDCHCPSGEGESLWVIGGTNDGDVAYFPVNCSARLIGFPEAVLLGGHSSIVRTVLPLLSRHQPGGMLGWTGGEDGRLCCWLSDYSVNQSQSWLSDALVSRSSKTYKKLRHHPYS